APPPALPPPAQASAARHDVEPSDAPASSGSDDRVDDTAKARNENHASSLLLRASAKHENADVKARLTEARAYAKDHPTEPRALRAWATAAIQAGETREARRAAEAWAVHDTGAEPRLFLAGALEAGGRRREARAVLEEWLANHPDTPEARKMLQHL